MTSFVSSDSSGQSDICVKQSDSFRMSHTETRVLVKRDYGSLCGFLKCLQSGALNSALIASVTFNLLNQASHKSHKGSLRDQTVDTFLISLDLFQCKLSWLISALLDASSHRCSLPCNFLRDQRLFLVSLRLLLAVLGYLFCPWHYFFNDIIILRTLFYSNLNTVYT